LLYTLYSRSTDSVWVFYNLSARLYTTMKSFAFLCIAVAFLDVVNCIQMEVVANKERCVYEEFRPDTLITGKVSVNPVLQDQQLALKVADSAGNPVYENRDVRESTFAFTSQSEEEYSFCLTDVYGGSEARANRVATLMAEQGDHKQKDYEAVAWKENLKPIELELRKIEDSEESLKTEFTYIKNREARHRNTNESTNARVFWMSIVSLLILTGLGVFQVYYLKRYFKSKKLI